MEKVDLFGFSDVLSFCRKNPILVTSLVTAGIGVYALRKYFAGGVCYSQAKLHGKTVVITGANTGIGRETARDLAKRGARVILACRDLTKGERAASGLIKETGNDQIFVKVVDLASLKSVRNFCKDVLSTEKQIDILINNAGVMACPQWKSEDGFDLQFGVNHLAHFLLTNLLFERIKSTPNSRIVNVSSLSHEEGAINWDDINFEENYHPWKAYSQSKLANVLFTRELTKRLQGSSTSVFVLHPGVVKTELGRHLPFIVPKWKQILYIPVISFMFKTSAQGAQTSIYCAVQEGLEKLSGKYFSDCKEKDPAPQAKDDESAQRLWELSAKMVGLEK